MKRANRLVKVSIQWGETGLLKGYLLLIVEKSAKCFIGNYDEEKGYIAEPHKTLHFA